MTPFEKLSGLAKVEDFLKKGVTLESLRAEARKMSDNEAATRMNQARQKLFVSIHQRSQRAA